MTDATGPDEPTPVDPDQPTEPTPVDPTPAEPAAASPDPATEPITVLDPTEPAAATPAASTSAPADRSDDDGTVRVQRWVVLALAAFAVGAVGFALGWIAAPGDGDGGERASVTIETPRDLRDMFGPGGPFGQGRGGQDRGDQGPGGQGRGEDRNGRDEQPRADGAFLGVVTRAVDDPEGARIERVVEDSPAEDADLEVGDVITKVDDEDVDGPEELAEAIREHDPDDEVTITYVRDGETATARVKLGDRASVDLRAPGGPSFRF